MSRIDYSVTIFDIAKVQIIPETASFWITFLWLKNIKSLTIREITKRFGIPLQNFVSQNV